MYARFHFGVLLKGGLTVLISVVMIYGIVQAGSLTPSASPAATSHTLSDIYTRLTTNGASTAGNHVFSPGASPAGTLSTLTQIYNAIPTIDATKVLSGTSYLGVAGTWNVSNLSNSVIKSGTTWGVSLGSTGTLTPDGGTAGLADLFNGKTAHLTADWTLDTGTLNLACNTDTFDATGNRAADAYDGAGNGTDRWCMTDSGNATASDMLTGKQAWVDGVSVSGTIPTQILSGTSETVSAGYYNATTLSAVDADLAVGNIKNTAIVFGLTGTLLGDTDASKVCSNASAAGTLSVTAASLGVGNTWCGTAGTLLANLWNGTNTGSTFLGGSQANGGVDDWNNGDGPNSNTYNGAWTACNAGNSYCATSDTNAYKKDNSTGLIWSAPCNGSGCSSFSYDTPATYSWDSSGANNNSRTASQLCSDHAGWSLPHQKQLMQAYIDGSQDLSALDLHDRSYWSATTDSATTANAFAISLSRGLTASVVKTVAGTHYVRCVR
ncbi:DUF1566 domain-containing protein [Candidatus Uhrbacteria bacterium]|nr:DUF1566 domain-containing protein [Candidatus Uhrbacteria bacterium]